MQLAGQMAMNTELRQVENGQEPPYARQEKPGMKAGFLIPPQYGLGGAGCDSTWSGLLKKRGLE